MQARILSHATNVCNGIIFPHGWDIRWPEFYAAITHLGRSSKWVHDDAPDMLTGIAEDLERGSEFSQDVVDDMRERRIQRGGYR